jgi:hypothetical protein
MTAEIRTMLTDLMGDVIPEDHYFDTRRDAIASAVEFVESTEENKAGKFSQGTSPGVI